MKLALLMSSASRRSGGLFWAVGGLAKAMAAQGLNACVFAGADLELSEDRKFWVPVPVDPSLVSGTPAFGWQPHLAGKLVQYAPDLVHTQGLWMHPSVAAHQWHRRTGRPYLVTPHGMLDPWAVQNSRLRKRLAGWLYEDRHLHDAACLHALCAEEADAFRAYGLRNPIAVIPNGVDLPDLTAQPQEPGWWHRVTPGAKVLLFLGRLHPKKGLPQLLEAWCRSRAIAGQPWVLVVAGWDQAGHQAELEAQVTSLGISGRVLFVGPLFGAEKTAALMWTSAFVLPSLSEGLPMAVLEAWAHGLPVLMTPQCNLSIGFKEDAALCAEPTAESMKEGLQKLFRMDNKQLAEMGHRGRRLIESEFNWEHIASQMIGVYGWVLGQGPMPSCVLTDY